MEAGVAAGLKEHAVEPGRAGAVTAGGRVGSFLQFKESAKRRAHTRMVDEESGSCDVSRVNSCAAGVFSLSSAPSGVALLNDISF